MQGFKYKFSVIIPTYNRSASLDRCLSSLVKQTYKDFEVIICDDGSIDNTKETVENYKKELKIKYIYQDNWGGPAKPRNAGIISSESEWICFLDSDDWYSDNRLQFLADLDLNKYDLLYHDLEIVSGHTNTGRITSRQLNNKDIYHDLLYNLNAIPTSSTCIRKKILDEVSGFSEERSIIGLEDYDLWIRLGKLNIRTKYIPMVMGSYYIGDNNITYSDYRQIARFKALFTYFIEITNDPYEISRIQASLSYSIGILQLKNGDIKDGYNSLVKSLLSGSVRIKIRSIYHMIKGLKYTYKK